MSFKFYNTQTNTIIHISNKSKTKYKQIILIIIKKEDIQVITTCIFYAEVMLGNIALASETAI